MEQNHVIKHKEDKVYESETDERKILHRLCENYVL
jgi:hypothetical protein